MYLGGDLFACHPVCKMATVAGDDFIFTCEPTSHKALYDFIDGRLGSIEYNGNVEMHGSLLTVVLLGDLNAGDGGAKNKSQEEDE